MDQRHLADANPIFHQYLANVTFFRYGAQFPQHSTRTHSSQWLRLNWFPGSQSRERGKYLKMQRALCQLRRLLLLQLFKK